MQTHCRLPQSPQMQLSIPAPCDGSASPPAQGTWKLSDPRPTGTNTETCRCAPELGTQVAWGQFTADNGATGSRAPSPPLGHLEEPQPAPPGDPTAEGAEGTQARPSNPVSRFKIENHLQAISSVSDQGERPGLPPEGTHHVAKREARVPAIPQVQHQLEDNTGNMGQTSSQVARGDPDNLGKRQASSRRNARSKA